MAALKEAVGSKRKSKPEDDDDEENADAMDQDGEGGDVEMLDVSFEFFDPQAIDYHAIKLLLAQLLSHDANLVDLAGITDLILEQKLVGSTVKTDGAESDPYALLTVLNLNVHKNNPAISSLLKYLLPKLAGNEPLHTLLTSLLEADATSSTAGKPTHVGLVVSERLVNMPPQVVPPMYTMLTEELQWAIEDAEQYHFSHLLFLSRVFLSSADELDEDPNAAINPGTADSATDRKSKKKKSKKAKTAVAADVASGGKGPEQVWMYHAEDDFISRFAKFTDVFKYTSSPPKSDTGDSFGVETRGQVMLLEWPKFADVVSGLEGFLGGLGS